jgi:hypothetical protein
MSFLQELKNAAAQAVARDADEWRLPLERLRGQGGDDGIERITTKAVLDVLHVPQRERVAVIMTPAQIAEAQRLAREWKPH